MKKIAVYIFIALFSLTGRLSAQVDQSPEVAVIEHLGATIPLDLQFVNLK